MKHPFITFTIVMITIIIHTLFQETTNNMLYIIVPFHRRWSV